MKRRHFNQAALAALASGFGLKSVQAQSNYPGKLITLVVAYSSGGSTDQRARQIGRFFSDTLGQPVVIDNRPGAAGNIGTEFMARAKPDGYTIGMGNLAPLAVNPWLFKKMGFDPAKDLTKIALIERGPLILVVPLGSPFKSVADVVTASKVKQGGLSYGSSGAGSAHHLCGEMFKAGSGGNMTHIPYRSGAAAMTDLFGGHLDFMFEPMYSALPSTQAGKLRALAITSVSRSPLVSEIITMEEAGFPGFHMENWQGLIGPADMPEAIVRLLNATVNKALADPAIKAQMLAQGNEIGGGTPEQFAALVKTESERWGKIVRANGIVQE